jgi:hypothetical protein
VPLSTAAKRLSAFRRPVRRRKCRQKSRQYGTLTTYEPRSGERDKSGGKGFEKLGSFLLKTDNQIERPYVRSTSASRNEGDALAVGRDRSLVVERRIIGQTLKVRSVWANSIDIG